MCMEKGGASAPYAPPLETRLIIVIAFTRSVPHTPGLNNSLAYPSGSLALLLFKDVSTFCTSSGDQSSDGTSLIIFNLLSHSSSFSSFSMAYDGLISLCRSRYVYSVWYSRFKHSGAVIRLPLESFLAIGGSVVLLQTFCLTFHSMLPENEPFRFERFWTCSRIFFEFSTAQQCWISISKSSTFFFKVVSVFFFASSAFALLRSFSFSSTIFSALWLTLTFLEHLWTILRLCWRHVHFLQYLDFV